MMRLIKGDCFKVLNDFKNESIDCVITDPPYGINFQSNYRKEKRDYIENDDNLDWMDEWLLQLKRIVKNNTGHYLFCSHKMIDLIKPMIEKHFNIKNIIIWVKNNWGMGDLKGAYANQYEMIIYFTKGRKILNGKRDTDIVNFDRTTNQYHPTQKPVDLIEFLISKNTIKGDIVIDTFMGSGTTGIAAQNIDRNFIGIEINDEYFEIAEKRITNTKKQLELEFK